MIENGYLLKIDNENNFIVSRHFLIVPDLQNSTIILGFCLIVSAQLQSSLVDLLIKCPSLV